MTSIKIQILTEEAFRPFGWMLGKAMPKEGLVFSNAHTDFWEEHLFNPGMGGETQILWVNYRTRQTQIMRLETHRLTQQVVVPLSREVVQVVALSQENGAVDLASVRAFRVRVGEGVCMRPGCWHTTRVEDGEARCLMLTRRSTTEDLIGHLKGGPSRSETALVDVAFEIA